MSDEADANLTGAWVGRYTYPHGEPDTPFVAELLDTGGPLTGIIGEVDRLEGPLRASIDGLRSGSSVRFTKFYDSGSADFDTVIYRGELSADRREITGEWTIPDALSGGFIMIRAAASAAESARAAAARV